MKKIRKLDKKYQEKNLLKKVKLHACHVEMWIFYKRKTPLIPCFLQFFRKKKQFAALSEI